MLVDVVAPVRIFHDDEHGVGLVRVQGDGKAEFGGQFVLDVDPVVAGVQRFVDAAVVLLIEHIRLARVLDEAVNALPELGIFIRQEVGARVLVGEHPALAAVVAAHAAHRGDADPHPVPVGGIGHNRMQAQPAGPRIPLAARGVIRQAGIDAPVLAAVGADPQAGRVNTSVDRPGLIGTPRLDRPDVDELFAAIG